MLTKIRNLENQDVLSCHAAAVVEEVESAAAAAAAGSHSKIGNKTVQKTPKVQRSKTTLPKNSKLFEEWLLYCYNF